MSSFKQEYKKVEEIVEKHSDLLLRVAFTYMKNISILLTLFLVTGIMQAQNRPQPKPGPSPMVQIKKPQKTIGLSYLLGQSAHALVPQIT